jgi:outer membrane lipoprotein-sorting protein
MKKPRRTGFRIFRHCLIVLAALAAFWLPAGAPSAAQETGEAAQEKNAAADVPSVEEIVAKANRESYYQGKDGRAKVTMTITDSQGRKSLREFIILRRDVPPGDAGGGEAAGEEAADEHCGDQQFYVYFQLPADVNKTVFMVWKHLDKPDDRWLYVPALDLLKRIAATEKRNSFVGSDFFYEDVSGRNVNDDVHELVDVTDNYFVLKNTPKDPDSVEFAHYTVWIHRKTFLPIKSEYVDKKGEKYREYQALKVDTIQGFNTVTKSRMKNLQTKGETVIEYSDVRYNVDLPEDVFTERYLRRAPAKYLK